MSHRQYTRAHSLGDGYTFDSSSGWQSVNVTNLSYKYGSQNRVPPIVKRGSNSKSTSKSLSLMGTVTHLIGDVWNGLKGIGTTETVKITWYTGHDLENPSCWSDSKWAPTDESFACALTLDGWTSRPKCFAFLEVCNGPKKCVYVRVVDTCAGCAPGSKHVDMTKSAFSELADLNDGVLMVQMREATNPDTWLEDLWGPKA
ncbi:hypothetical protein BD410DRAFT_811038 [Rickenella mellea]|uniref:Uncharacterized protein n=1 Tax=Rickenella mellea TaxID=50990 RepID=A0A4R5XE77_9AGAM|nr:hypothetical protein BD410DRAFT_811038 [Rickenella mellea]